MSNLVNLIQQLINFCNNLLPFTIGGSNGQVQYNNNGVLGGITNGTSGQVLTANSSGPPSFQNASGGSGAIQQLFKGTINLNTTADQTITLTGGTHYVITDILLTNASSTPVAAFGGAWWSGTGRTGTRYAIVQPITGSTDDLTLLTSSNAFINGVYSVVTGGASIELFPDQPPQLTNGSTLYFSLTTPQGSALTCDMYIYGYILN
jgi:hypothetical protein